MASNSKRLKLCSHNEDRISALPDAILCHILSFFSIRQAKNINSVTPPSHCFPCLKLLHVTFWFPYPHTVEKLFSSFPVLEDLIIDGEDSDASAFNLLYLHPNLEHLKILSKREHLYVNCTRYTYCIAGSLSDKWQSDSTSNVRFGAVLEK
ncbi:uncharacterized protein LOC133737764 isoform X2 [Rosa rugosa]|nr:uncharacterized protein LOC133737764 isoform X2 [Rosa rugosa]